MVIEFRCTGCQSLLRTADETAGRQAKCPQCGEIVPIPLTTAPQAAPLVPPVPPSGEPSQTPGYAPPSPRIETGNPFQSPTDYAPALDRETPLAARPTITPLVHSIIDIGEVINRAWTIYRSRFLISFIVGVAVMFLWMIINQAIAMPMQMIATSINDPVAGFAVMAGSSVVNQLIYLWISLGLYKFYLNLNRGFEPQLMDLFTANYALLPAIVVTILLWLLIAVALLPGAIVGGVIWAIVNATTGNSEAALAALIVTAALLGLIPFLYVTMGGAQAQMFIVDRRLGPIVAIKKSFEFAKGNRINLFVIYLVGGLLSCSGFVLLCCGILLTLHFIFPIMAVAYLLMTGQTTADQLEYMDPPPAGTPGV